jgi:pilus assembly protein Flp/PilA
MKKFFKRVSKNEDGVTALEYGLIAALIAVVIIAAVGYLGTSVSKSFNKVANAINSTASSSP